MRQVLLVWATFIVVAFGKENKLNKILNKYPYLPFIAGFVVLTILIIDLINFYK